MNILIRFNKIKLANGVIVTPVKVETMLYTESSKKIQWGFVDSNDELVSVGRCHLKPENDLQERIIYEDTQFEKAAYIWNKLDKGE